MSATQYAETQVVAVVLNDTTGARLSECRHLPPDAFTDPACRVLWGKMLAMAPGVPPGMALVGSGLSEADLRRIAETEFSSVNFAGHLASVVSGWTDRRLKSAAFAYHRGQIPISELAKEIAAADAVNLSREQQLSALRFNPDVKIPEPRIIYRIGKNPICTAGNLANITAEAKAGKTAFTGAMIAAPMAIAGADCLSVSAANPDGHALVHFDTETSKADWQKQLCQSKRRAGLEKFPPWIVSYHLTGRTPQECRRDVEDALAIEARRFGKIFAVFIDGVGDLVIDPNDPEECFPLVTRLHALAIAYDCAIVNVLHLNPGSSTKTRGHLGSQLERKAETNLTLEKDEDGNTVVYSLKQRGPSIPKADGPRFRWSDGEGMHVSCEALRAEREKTKAGQLLDLADGVFEGRQTMTWRELRDAIKVATGCKDSAADEKLSAMRKFNVVTRMPPNLYARAA